MKHFIVSALAFTATLGAPAPAGAWQLYPRMSIPVSETPSVPGVNPAPYAAPPVSTESLRMLEDEMIKALDREEQLFEEILEAREILRKRSRAKPGAASAKTALG